jgi:outer membrane protein insertion porin family
MPLPCVSQQRTIRSLTLPDSPALPASELRRALHLSEGSPIGEADRGPAAAALDSAYRDHGYYFARSLIRIDRDAADSNVADVTVTVDEGDYLPVRRLRIDGTTVFSADELLASLETGVGEPLRAQALERDLGSLLHRYATAGHPLASVSVADVSVDSAEAGKGLRVALAMDEGPLILITEVRVEGNTETHSDVILRAARVPVGEPFNADKVDEIAGRLNRLNIFSNVAEPRLYRTADGGGGMLLAVAEGSTNTFDGVIGYAPGGPGADGYVSGLVNVSMRNLFGTGRLFGVHWQRDDRSSQEVDLRYVEPWLFGYPVNIGAEFFQRQQESTYVHRVVTAHASVLASDEMTLNAHVSAEATIPSTETALPVVDEARALFAGVGVGYDTRDNLVSPTAGTMFRTDYEIGTKTVRPRAAGADEERVPVQRVSMDAEAYALLFQRQVLAAGVHGRERLGGDIGLADYYRLGGARTLRGYRESQFLGSRIAWSTLEYRYLLAPRSYAFGFIDAGYYFVPPDDARAVPSDQAFKYGYGVGVRTDTPLGSLGVSIALGGGDAFSQAKLHFGLINEF